jgi:hypothetical protein
MQTRVLGWDEKWVFMEHRFVRGGRVAGTVVMRGLFRAAGGVLTPAFLLGEMGVASASPQLPGWLQEWNRSCDALAGGLREEEKAA